jgi:hypothetical protein
MLNYIHKKKACGYGKKIIKIAGATAASFHVLIKLGIVRDMKKSDIHMT